MSIRIQEKTVQKVVKDFYTRKGYVVKREVRTPVGFIDHILYRDMGLSRYQKIIIEVKEFASIKHAIGQLLSYERYHQDCTGLKIIYFCRDGGYRGVDTIFQEDELRKQNPKLSIESINNLVDIGEVICQEEAGQKKSQNISLVDNTELLSSLGILNQDSVTMMNPTPIHPLESAEYLPDPEILTGVKSENISF